MQVAIHDFEKARRKRARKRTLRRLTVLVCICALVLIIIGIQGLLSSIPIMDMIRSTVSLTGKTGSYPIAVPDSTIYDVYRLKNNVLLKTDSDLYIYNRDGKEVLSVWHGMSDPAVDVAGDYLLYYVVGGDKVTVQSIYGSSKTIEVDNMLLKAYASENGNVLVYSMSKNNIYYLEAYNSKQERIFHMRIQESHVLNVSFTPDQQGVLVISFRAENGVMISRLSRYNFNQTSVGEGEDKWVSVEPIFQVEFADTFLQAAAYHGDTIIAVAETRCLFLNNIGEIQKEYQYGGLPLDNFDIETQDGAVLLFADYGASFTSSTLVSLDRHGDVRYAKAFDSHVDPMFVTSSVTYTLVDRVIEWYNISGEYQGKLELEDNVSDFIVIGGSAYLVGPRQLQKMELKGG